MLDIEWRKKTSSPKKNGIISENFEARKFGSATSKGVIFSEKNHHKIFQDLHRDATIK